MANIFKRGETWYGRVTHKGKEFKQSLDTTNKTVAKKRLDKWVDQLKASSWGEKPRRTFNEVVADFVVNHFKIIKPKSAERYGVSLVNLTPHFDGVYLDEITRSKLLEFEMARRKMVHRKKNISEATIRRDLMCLSAVFGHADALEWYDQNPVPGFLEARAKKGLRESDPGTRYLDHSEEDILLKFSEHHVMLHAAIIVAIDTGLRKEEQLALEWPMIDFKRKLVTVTGKGGKTRSVPLLDRTIKVLRGLPRHMRSKFMFWHDDGERYFDLYPQLQKTIKKTTISEHVKWHDLRRTCGCRLLQDHRLTMAEVSLWLGHSSVAVTEKVYAFLKVENLHNAIQLGSEAAALARLRRA